MKSISKPSLALLGLISLAVAAYWPGLQGGFLFDDFANLKDLGVYGGITDWETFKSFVLNGLSGPAGRPVSLMSFLLDDNTWPSVAAGFKATNLKIHLICGLLLCWANLLLLRQYKFGERKAQWMAVFASACWLLHPLMVSTTLYVVQRMAQLATFFVLAGIVGYLHGRSLLPERKRAAYLWMTASLGLGGILAILSKENGALLPLLLLTIEFCLPDSPCRPSRLWRGLFLALPSLILIAYLASLIDFSANPWPTRPFNQKERLWSEARILWEYLSQLTIPQIEGRGLFQDGYHLSRGWLSPWTTLPAVLGLGALFGVALFLRRRWPLVSLAILFFFAGHLLESSVVGLEPYFEHRNYLSAVFLFLPLAWALLLLARKIEKSLVFAIASVILAVFALFTWQRATLWGNSDKLELYWAYANPDSPRAHNSIASYLVNKGRFEEANAHIEAALIKMPDSALLNLRLLLQKVFIRKADEQDFSRTGERLVKQPFDAQAVMALRAVVDKVVEPDVPSFYRDATLRVIEHMEKNAGYNAMPLFRRLMPYLKGRLYLAKAEPGKACQQFEIAIPLYADTDAALMMVAEAASGGNFSCAQALLDRSERVLHDQKDISLKRSRTVYEGDIRRLRELIRTDAEEDASKPGGHEPHSETKQKVRPDNRSQQNRNLINTGTLHVDKRI